MRDILKILEGRGFDGHVANTVKAIQAGFDRVGVEPIVDYQAKELFRFHIGRVFRVSLVDLLPDIPETWLMLGLQDAIQEVSFFSS